MKPIWSSWIIAGAIALSSISSQSAHAQSVYSISANHAQGLTGSQSPVVKLWPGYGTNLSFLATNETLVRVWIDDPARVALDFDEPLCPMTAESDCVAGNPSVIHLRRIQGLDFEHLPQADGTLLTVMTETAGGDRHLYEFRIEFATGEPDYHTVAIEPTSPLHPVIGLIDVQRGLQIAEARELISREQDLWHRLQTFLTLARGEMTIPAAAEQAGVSLDVITQLAAWGAAARDDPVSIPTTF